MESFLERQYEKFQEMQLINAITYLDLFVLPLVFRDSSGYEIDLLLSSGNLPMLKKYSNSER